MFQYNVWQSGKMLMFQWICPAEISWLQEKLVCQSSYKNAAVIRFSILRQSTTCVCVVIEESLWANKFQ